jgi:hypothetical protein
VQSLPAPEYLFGAGILLNARVGYDYGAFETRMARMGEFRECIMIKSSWWLLITHWSNLWVMLETGKIETLALKRVRLLN